MYQPEDTRQEAMPAWSAALVPAVVSEPSGQDKQFIARISLYLPCAHTLQTPFSCGDSSPAGQELDGGDGGGELGGGGLGGGGG
jgi:hypothetical protein